jgi:hypothetical protein
MKIFLSSSPNFPKKQISQTHHDLTGSTNNTHRELSVEPIASTSYQLEKGQMQEKLRLAGVCKLL